MTRPQEEPRPHANVGVPPLAERRLEGEGIRELEVARARTTGGVAHTCSVSVWSPHLTDGRGPARPPLMLPHPPELETPRAAGPDEGVHFEWDGSVVRAQVLLPEGTSCYGTGAVPGPLLRTGRSIRLWNTDAWCYGEESPALYQSHPYVLAVLPDGTSIGLLADSFRRGRVEIAADGVEFQFDDEPFDLYCIEGPHPAEVQRALASLVGRMPMPPVWALGYHQCRWSYMSAREVLEVATGLRERDIPCDAIWLDIDYMDRFRVFTWNDETFPDPKALIDALHAMDFRVVAILDPGIACDPDYEVYESGLEGDHFVRDAAGRPVKGRVWPGLCHFPDFTSPRTREWWSVEVERFLERTPLDGLWNDMNEPSLFRCPGATLPDDARHAGDERTGEGTHARFHNVYGQLMAQATRAGLERHAPDRRPFVLTRANHVTGSRHAATWTGDNQSRWEDLRWSISMALNLGLSGQPFCGPDAGGFTGDPSPELFSRWYDLAAFLPFFRGHGEKHSCRKEPWSFGEVEAYVRLAIERRMRLLPTLTTLFHEAAKTGVPVVRPLFFAAPTDARLRDVDDSFLLGDDLLVAPVVEPGAIERDVLLPDHPGGGWYPYPDGPSPVSGRILAPASLGSIPVFARAGSIVVETETAATTNGAETRPLVYRLFLDEKGEARGRFFVGADEAPGKEEGRTSVIQLSARLDGDRLRIEELPDSGVRQPPRQRDVLVHRPDGTRASSRIPARDWGEHEPPLE